MNNQVAAFEIIDPKTGQRWMIYADGQVRGFGASVVIINRIPNLIQKKLLEIAKKNIGKCQ